MRRLLFAITGVLLLVGSPVLADTALVKVGHNHLDPAELTVPAGSTVTFRNEQEMPGGHTIVAVDGSFESPGLAKGEEWSHTFDEPGTYLYTIKQHPTAQGKIIVE